MCTTTMIKTPQIDGRPVLQPACNRLQSPLPGLKEKALLTPPSKLSPTSHKPSLPISPKSKFPLPGHKRGNDPNVLNSSVEKLPTPRSTPTKSTPLVRKKSRSSGGGGAAAVSHDFLLNCSSSSLIVEAPGTIAAVRREQVNLLQAQRKMKIAHYGRTPAKLQQTMVPVDLSVASTAQEEKRCSFITPNSDPIYVAYHDEEWGVPVRDDRMLFELLVLTGAQVGSDWTSILKKRNEFRAAFADFEVESVANFSEKRIVSIAADYSMDLSRIRGAVDNANRILQIRTVFGSFEAYLWGFVNNKPISTQYRSCRKIPVKTSKSESLSKDMVRRGFRLVGPTVMHSFMQAAGLTNDHLVTCPRHSHCASFESARRRASLTPHIINTDKEESEEKKLIQ